MSFAISSLIFVVPNKVVDLFLNIKISEELSKVVHLFWELPKTIDFL
jgi:hypothetical protein